MPELKPELSPKSKYWIPKHRYYELKHYCLQYPEWEKLYFQIGLSLSAHENQEVRSDKLTRYSEELAVKRIMLFNAMQNITSCIENSTDEIVLRDYIFKGVTQGLSYTQLSTQNEIPCGPDMYYDIYRKFFWLLSRKRGI